MKKHKIEFTEQEMKRMQLAIGYYCHLAVERDAFFMLIEKEILDRIRKVFIRRIFDCQFNGIGKSKITLRQLEVDLLNRCLGEMSELEDIMLLKIKQITHKYAC